MESSSSESEHQEEDDFENDSGSSAIPTFRQNNLQNSGIARSSSSLSDSNDQNVANDMKKYAEDRRSEKSHDIFDSENENNRTASSLPDVRYFYDYLLHNKLSYCLLFYTNFNFF